MYENARDKTMNERSYNYISPIKAPPAKTSGGVLWISESCFNILY